MKRLVCEMCGGTDLVKQDGVFVCQNCGTKYSVEEAKKMMVEGAVTVEGTVSVEGTVKVDKSEQLKKLYILAERARKSNNSDNAVRYYNEIMFEDPNSWEANFYLVYFKAKNTNVGSIPSVCYDLINNYQSTFELLVQEKGEDIVTELNMLLDDIKRYCFTIINSTRGMQEECMYWSKALDCLSSYGDKLVESYGDKYKDIAIRAWKETIDLYLQIMNSCESAGLAESTANLISFYFDITAVVTKIYNFDCTYEDPWGVTKDLRKNEKFITCPKCGTKMREHESKCPQCGTPKDEIQRLIKEQAEREAAERERLRKEREAKEAEEARFRAEKRAEWWAANKKKVIITILMILALVVVVIVYHKIKEKRQYQLALAEAKAYIASGDSCVAIYHFDEAKEFYDKAKRTKAEQEVHNEITKKESALRNAQNEMQQKQERLERERIAKEELEKKKEEEAKQRIYDNLVIPSGTTKIPRYAYAGKAIKSIIIPNSVTSIGGYAFENCSCLTSITLPNSITNLDEGGIFSGCTRLTSITLPSSITNIGSSTFEGCSNLKSITIPNSVTSIGGCAFYECSSLTSVTIPNSVTSLGQTVFSDCVKLKEVNLSENLKKIDNFTFRNCRSLETICIPENVNRIDLDVFLNCTNLRTIICKAKTPPIISRLSFEGVDKSIPVYVPALSVEAYRNADHWREFTNIKAIRE